MSLPDVEALEELFTKTALVELLYLRCLLGGLDSSFNSGRIKKTSGNGSAL